MKKYSLITIVLFISLFYSCKTGESPATDDGVKVMAYFYPSRGDFDPGTLTLDKLTHIIYSFTEVIDKGLAGIMFWQLVGDAEKDGLVDAIYKEKKKY